jgi:hypothetical protein
MMTEGNLATLVSGVCHDTGRMKGIDFHPPAAWGAQVPGRWEAGYRLRRQGHSTVTLTYWFTLNSLLSEEVILPWTFPPTPEQSEKFKSDVSGKIEAMLQWL